MTMLQILDATGLAVLTAQGGWILLLYRRMGRLRLALDEAGDIVGSLDEASRRLDAAAGGIVGHVRDGIAEVDSKILSCRRLSQELSSAARSAEEVASRLDQALRLNRRLNQARAAAPPRELVEPLGLAERLDALPPAEAPGLAAACPVSGNAPPQETSANFRMPLPLRLALPSGLPADLLDLLATTEGAPPCPPAAPAAALPPPWSAAVATTMALPPPALEDILAAELRFAEPAASLASRDISPPQAAFQPVAMPWPAIPRPEAFAQPAATPQAEAIPQPEAIPLSRTIRVKLG